MEALERWKRDGGGDKTGTLTEGQPQITRIVTATYMTMPMRLRRTRESSDIWPATDKARAELKLPDAEDFDSPNGIAEKSTASVPFGNRLPAESVNVDTTTPDSDDPKMQMRILPPSMEKR